MAFKITNKGLYWGLIVTFGLLYILVAFVSTLHAIDFFKLANITSLAVLLGIAYEVGQATVLFSILMTKNKEKFLPWLLMILLTGLQVTANVYASFKHMSISGNNDWTYWYTSILKIFGVAGGTAETYQVIISWISGALLPIVALGMTALVAQNIKLITEEGEAEELDESVDASDLISEVSRMRPTEDDLEMAEAVLSKKTPEGYFEKEIPLDHPTGHEPTTLKDQEEIKKIKKLMTMDPVESGSISDDLKQTISPGIEVEVEVETPIDEIVPALSEEEVRAAFMDELEGKEPESIPEILGIEPTPTEDVAQIPPENDPETVPNEPETVDIEPKDMGEVLTDLSERVESPPSPPPIEPSPEEQEEARLEHLRNIARGNLKKNTQTHSSITTLPDNGFGQRRVRFR